MARTGSLSIRIMSLISDHGGSSSLISKWGSTIKSPWIYFITSWYLSWYDFRRCKPVKLKQTTNLPPGYAVFSLCIYFFPQTGSGAFYKYHDGFKQHSPAPCTHLLYKVLTVHAISEFATLVGLIKCIGTYITYKTIIPHAPPPTHTKQPHTKTKLPGIHSIFVCCCFMA